MEKARCLDGLAVTVAKGSQLEVVFHSKVHVDALLYKVVTLYDSFSTRPTSLN